MSDKDNGIFSKPRGGIFGDKNQEHRDATRTPAAAPKPPESSYSAAAPASAAGQDRVIRVFISSTFRDMQAERELLIKRIFPELRSVCAKRFVTFTEVDLRWGITEEQAAEGKVLPICLEEIERSRPYFIGLLGERYGWIPASVPQEVIDREPWLKEHVGNRTSVTELEIIHGVLKNPAMAKHAFFYFRDPSYIETLPEAEQREMVERPIPEDIRTFGEAEAVRRTEERKAKLAALKERIRLSGLPVLYNYANPEALAGAVRQQFIDLIDRLYPEPAVPDVLTREARSHESYAQNKLRAYVERPAHTEALDAFVSAESTGQGLVITGESGGGKTALLAAWMRKWRQSNPEIFSFEHYFGATPDSADISAFLVRLLGELKHRYSINEDIPSDPAKLREILPHWLAQATGADRVVLIFDALNQIEGDEADRRLAWLPRFLPPHIRVIASALPGLSLDALRERGWQEHALPPAGEAERNTMIDVFLSHYRKTLQANLRQKIASASGATNPLFLRTVLEELRQFGSFDDLPDEVARYLEASTLEELFGLVIQRWRQDFDGKSGLVRRALRHLWAARQGLSETEWLDLVITGKTLSRQEWIPFFLALEPHLSQRAGLFAFGHDFLRQAVKGECIGNDEDVHLAHHELADFFERQELTPRSTTELPWQLREAGERDRLRTCLLDMDRFLLIDNRDRNELMRYWVWLDQERAMGKSYLEAFEPWSRMQGRQDLEISYTANQLFVFLLHASLYFEAEPLMRRALAINEQSFGKDHPRIATELNNLAQLLQDTNRLAEAEPLMRKHVEIFLLFTRTTGHSHPHLQAAISNYDYLLQDMGRSEDDIKVTLRSMAPELFEN